MKAMLSGPSLTKLRQAALAVVEEQYVMVDGVGHEYLRVPVEAIVALQVALEAIIDAEADLEPHTDDPCEKFLTGDPDYPYVCARCGHEEKAH